MFSKAHYLSQHQANPPSPLLDTPAALRDSTDDEFIRRFFARQSADADHRPPTTDTNH